MNIVRNGFIKSLSTVSLQRKLLLFIVIALSLIVTLSSIYIYKLVKNTFIESEKNHIAVIAESLSSKVGVWYFINSETDSSIMDKFLQN